MHINQHLEQPLSSPPTADGNKYGDPQQDSERDTLEHSDGVLSPCAERESRHNLPSVNLAISN